MVVSLSLLGAFFGALIAGPLADHYGRKPIVIFSSILYTIGVVVMAFANSLEMLMVGRLIVGIDIGIDSMIVPVYLSEIAPLEIRGSIVSISILAISFG